VTAFLSFPYADRIELLADGAACLPSGVLIAATDKIVVSPHLPIAMVGRGNHGDLRTMTGAILRLCECGSVDETLNQLAGALADVRAEPGEPPDQHFEIAIAAYSESRGPMHFILSSFDAGEERPSWTLLDWSGQMIGGGPVLAADEVTAAGLGEASFAAGAADCGLALMELMRAKPGSDPTRPDGVHGYWIGSHVDHAVVSAAGVKVKRLKTWPDPLFKPIEPSALSLNPRRVT
jgi:hypothetical protein